MSDVSYWQSQLKKLQSNPPKKAANYYNKSFVERIAEANQNISNLVAEKDKAYAATQQAQDDYKTFEGSMTTYYDAYRNAEAKYGVEYAGAQYEKSKEALLDIERTLDMLPSTINANSEVRLNRERREARYNMMADKINARMSDTQKSTDVFKDVWDNLREKTSAEAQAIVGSEQNTLQTYNNAWITAQNNFEDAEKRWTAERTMKSQIESDYRAWQQKQYGAEYKVWQANIKTAQTRLAAAQATARAAAEAAARKKAADAAAAAIKKKTYKAALSKSGYSFKNGLGESVRFGTYISQFSGDYHKNAVNYIKTMAKNGDENAKRALEVLKYNPNLKLTQNTGKNFVANNYKFLSKADNDALSVLGLKLK